MTRNNSATSKLRSTGESVAQVEQRKDASLSIEAQRNSWLANGLSMDEVALLLSAKAKDARKKAKHQQVTALMPREVFAAKAKAKTVTVDGVNFIAVVKAHDPTKSYGWTLSDKQTVVIDGVKMEAQLSFNLTIIGSKPIGGQD